MAAASTEFKRGTRVVVTDDIPGGPEGTGGKVGRAAVVMHGKLSQVSHEGLGVFEGLPNPFSATRYHSLVVERKSLPDCLDITAELEDGTIMGLQHKTLPIHGVQFHPESIASQHGHAMLKNFLAWTEAA